MRSYLQETKVKNYARLGRILGYGGLGVMGLGFVLSFRQPYDVTQVFTIFLFGMLASQIGLPLVNRWGRHPRVDEILDGALRGLDARFGLFHYCLGVDHALIAPAGVFVVIPRVEAGLIECGEKGWQRTARRRDDSLKGKPRKIRGLDRAIKIDTISLRDRLAKILSVGEQQIPPVGALVVFLHARAEVMERACPIPTTHVKKLKATLRKLPKGQSLADGDIQRLAERVGLAG